MYPAAKATFENGHIIFQEEPPTKKNQCYRNVY